MVGFFGLSFIINLSINFNIAYYNSPSKHQRTMFHTDNIPILVKPQKASLLHGCREEIISADLQLESLKDAPGFKQLYPPLSKL